MELIPYFLQKVKGLLDNWANKEEYLVQGHYLSIYRFKYQNLRDRQKNRGNLLNINVLKVSSTYILSDRVNETDKYIVQLLLSTNRNKFLICQH